MANTEADQRALDVLSRHAAEQGLDVRGGKIRRTSSRFCLGVEHGDYNGTELFGVGTDRFIWLAYKPNDVGRIRLFSANFPDEGVVGFVPGRIPAPRAPEKTHCWARYPYGVDHVLRREGHSIQRGFDGVIFGDIPGGGMSRSASLTLNLTLTALEVNGIEIDDPMRLVDIAQAVENDYIGSPCGQLDQIMILFAKAGMGTHYRPRERQVEYVPLGNAADDFCLVSLDTGTVRLGLEKSTYRVRRAECEELARMARDEFGISCLADVRDHALLDRIEGRYLATHPNLVARLQYVFNAQERFSRMLSAWKEGDIETVGSVFRQDGYGLRDVYKISGPELESMCDIARTVPGVLGERMLGGGDKGAAGAIARSDSVDALREAVAAEYPRRHPEYAERYAVHVCRVVDGVKVLPGVE
jgi:galactokinase